MRPARGAPPVAGGGVWRGRLAGLAAAERERVAAGPGPGAGRGGAGACLGRTRSSRARAFRDLGFDSLTAVELRNRLTAADRAAAARHAGLRLPDPGRAGRVPARRSLARADAAPVAGRWPRRGAGRGGRRMSRWRSWGWAAGSRAGWASAEELWELVAAGGDAIGGVPGRPGLGSGELYDPVREPRGRLRAGRAGSWTARPSFDAGFFGISPREALAMDPQQRLLLEVRVGGAGGRRDRPGVAAGHRDRGVRRGHRPRLRDAGRTAGDGAEGLPADRDAPAAWCRAGWRTCFGLEGPAVTVDTACSSSLVAMHLAVQALRSGECSLALAGGVTVMATPGVFVEFSAAARAGRRRPVQGVSRRRRTGRAGPRVRGAGAGAAVGCAAERAPGAGGGARAAR